MITIEEAKKAMDEMMAQGTTEDEMLGILYLMFQSDEISLDELEALIDALGYEFSEEFRNMTPEQQKTDGFEINDDAEGVTDEQVEDAKETQKDEVQSDGSSDGKDEKAGSEGQDNNEQHENQDQGNSEKDNKNDKEEDVEAEERAKARKLYGFDK